MRFLSKSILFVSAVSILSGCSDDGSSSSFVGVEGWVGAQGFSNAQVVPNQITESGQVSMSDEGLYIGARESTDAKSRFSASVDSDEVLMFIARGQIADVDDDKDNEATSRQCQLAAGCSVYDLDTGITTEYAFSDYYPETSGFEWRSIVYTVNSGSHNNVNPITSLASSYAYQYDVLSLSNVPAENEVFTAYDVILANSQVSKLLELGDIIGETPANLTKLNSFNSNALEVRNQIRYGALIAAIQEKELAYRVTKMPTDPDYVTLLVEEFTADFGQFYFNGSSDIRLLSLADLYETAYENLELVLPNVTNIQAKSATEQVVEDLKTQAENARDESIDVKTSINPDLLSELLTATEEADFDLGIEKTKAFVNSLLTYQDTFWQDGYKTELDTYLEFLKTLRDQQQVNLNLAIDEFKNIQEYYVTCIIGGVDCNGTFADLNARKISFDATTNVLVLDNGGDGEITVSQSVADVNLIDDDNPTSSNAIDINITGTIEKNGLVLNLAHSYDEDDDDVIALPSSMRIYYTEEVSEVDPSLTVEGYELNWGEFELYDITSIDTAAETELEGSFRIFYLGVRDPNDLDNSELRFNIESWSLSTTINDNVNVNDTNDDETALIFISGSSSNPDEYYPEKEFSSFNGFFTPNEETSVVGETESGLLTYEQGTEMVTLGSLTFEVKTVDFINSLGDDVRYRFYPDETEEDAFDSDGDGDYEELVDFHRIEQCELNDAGLVESCGPKTKVYDKRNVQDTINELWGLGLFQSISVPSVGTYHVDFPATPNTQGCYVLDALEQLKVLDGELIKPQVLGLDSLRMYAEVYLLDDQGDSLPATLLDISIIAPTQDTYQVNAALSHNYSSSSSIDNTGIILGSGSYASVLAISYDTSSDFENMGNISISKSGVILSSALGGTEEDQDMTAFLTQSYDPASIQYKIIENEDGLAERCVLSTDASYIKDPSEADEVFYINYRGVVYATARKEGNAGIWTIRYIDGSWMIPSADGSSTSGDGW